METKISDRINEAINRLGYNVTTFSKAIGLSNNVTIGRIIKENRNPSFEVIEKILQTFGSISPDWLITGNGPMLKKDIKEKVIYKSDMSQIDRLESMNIVLFKEVKKTRSLPNSSNSAKKKMPV